MKPPWDITDEEIANINIEDLGDLEDILIYLRELPDLRGFFAECIQRKLRAFWFVSEEHLKLFRSHCANGNLSMKYRLRVYDGGLNEV